MTEAELIAGFEGLDCHLSQETPTRDSPWDRVCACDACDTSRGTGICARNDAYAGTGGPDGSHEAGLEEARYGDAAWRQDRELR
jgi:hypothetical protein